VPRLVFAAGFALCSLFALLSSRAAAYPACLPGHNTVVPPCDWDSGKISLTGYSPASGTEITGGGGHHTIVSFPYSSFGAGIQAAYDVGYAPYSATDSGGTTTSGTLTVNLTANGGTGFKKLRFALIHPQVTGAGSISWSFTTSAPDPPGSVSGNQTTSSGDLVYGSAVGTISPTIALTASTGGSGSATFDGYAIYVPEPDRIAMLGSGVGLLWLLARRRSLPRVE